MAVVATSVPMVNLKEAPSEVVTSVAVLSEVEVTPEGTLVVSVADPASITAVTTALPCPLTAAIKIEQAQKDQVWLTTTRQN